MYEFSYVSATDIYLSIVLKFATIQNETKRAEMKKCNRQSTITIRKQLFLNQVHDQAGFGRPVINGRDFIYLDISKIVFTVRKLERLIFDDTHIIFGG